MSKIIYIDIVSAVTDVATSAGAGLLHPRLLFSPTKEALPLNPDLTAIDQYNELMEDFAGNIRFVASAPCIVYDDKLINAVNIFINKFLSGVAAEDRKFTGASDSLALGRDEFIASYDRGNAGRLLMEDHRGKKYSAAEIREMLLAIERLTAQDPLVPPEVEGADYAEPDSPPQSMAAPENDVSEKQHDAADVRRVKKKQKQKKKTAPDPAGSAEDDFRISPFSAIFVLVIILAFSLGFYFFMK